MRNSTIVYPVKVEYGSEISNIFVLKMMMKSGLEKNILKFLYAQSLFWKIFFTLYRGIFASNCKFSNKNDLLCAWRDFNKTFCGICNINECLRYKFHPYSILTGHIKVELLAY